MQNGAAILENHMEVPQALGFLNPLLVILLRCSGRLGLWSSLSWVLRTVGFKWKWGGSDGVCWVRLCLYYLSFPLCRNFIYFRGKDGTPQKQWSCTPWENCTIHSKWLDKTASYFQALSWALRIMHADNLSQNNCELPESLEITTIW